MELEARIRRALEGHGQRRGPMDFADSPSAIKKAQRVISIAAESLVPLDRCAVLSVGGADGTELEHVLANTGCRSGILLEYDDELASLARQKASALHTRGKEMHVLTGDAVQKSEDALELIRAWQRNGSIDHLVVTMHAVLHELPDRGSRTNDIETFLNKFLWNDIPVLLIAREPCAPRDLPPTVYLSANCSPKTLAELAEKIRLAHPHSFGTDEPQPMAQWVRLNSRLAAETIVKLFYLDSFPYEIRERVTSFSRDELLIIFRRVFGDNVRHEDFQSDSFDKLWAACNLQLRNADLTQMAKPQLHMLIVAKWFPPRPSKVLALKGAETTEGTASLADSNGGGTDAACDLQRHSLSLDFGPTALTDLPDILTPGSLSDFVPDRFARHFPREALDRLAALGEDGVVAVEEGDFSAHITIGTQILREAVGIPQIQSAGHYFMAEGYRLKEGLEKDPATKQRLLDQSSEHYRRALEIYPDSSRAIRGSARVLQVGGQFESALDLYARAKGMTFERAHSPFVHFERPLLWHEILRITRHEIHCIIEMRATNPSSKWRRANKESELAGYLVQSENLHREYLPAFAFRSRWQFLEWFMALVFFGKVWGDLGNSFQMATSLLNALRVRRLMITTGRPLTQIERANLGWWVESAASRDRTRVWGRMVPGVDKLEAALASGSDSEILRCVDDLISYAVPPWEQLPDDYPYYRNAS